MTQLVPADAEKKRAFAFKLLQNPTKPIEAAKAVFPGDMATACTVSVAWVNDPEIIELQQKLLEEYGEEHFLPSKADVGRELYKIGTQYAADNKDKIKALETFSRLMGYLGESSTNINNFMSTSNRVMMVPENQTIDSWAHKAKDNQASLIEKTQNAANFTRES